MKFYVSHGLLTLALFVGLYTGAYYDWFSVPSPLAPAVILVPASFTAIIYSVLSRRSGGPDFTTAYLVSIVLKMLTSSAFVLFVIVRDRAGAIENIIIFLVSYVLFTALEVGFLFRQINR
jgi:hypothetical protein